ncbi:hypothetical protein SteCoe_22493 [Stentor coeruleus]|uniref:Uncharacterized protein n=1 Tax=Stentor coeruleus TaxID=5963 RepID=A0A1R2BM42_9CILI|nr:hypothetical protein SteCoe_22493 [Stentor coeruleus]
MERRSTNLHRAPITSQQESEIKNSQNTVKSEILYLKLNECVQKFYISILAESAKQIKLIKQNAESTIKNILSLKALINREYTTKTLAITTIWKVKALVKQEIESSFSKEFELFWSFLDILISELPNNTQVNLERPQNIHIQIPQVTPMQVPQVFNKQRPIHPTNTSSNSFSIKKYNGTQFPPLPIGLGTEWGTLNKQKMYKVLPQWIQEQIEQGIKGNIKEITIYQSDKPVSIADVEKMQYYYSSPEGKKSGQGMPLIRR